MTWQMSCHASYSKYHMPLPPVCLQHDATVALIVIVLLCTAPMTVLEHSLGAVI